MARRRTNSGKFAENFAKSFTSTLSALARAKYYDSLIDKNKGLSADEMAKRLGGGSASGASGASGSSGRGLSSAEQQAAAQKYMDYMVNEKGVSPKVAAGIIGNIAAESSFNPTIPGDNGNSFGLFQFNKKGEMPYLEKWAAANNRDIRDGFAQIDHVLDQKNGRFKSMFERMEKASGPKEVATIFSDEYERPAAATANKARRTTVADEVHSGFLKQRESIAKSEAGYKPGAVQQTPVNGAVPASAPASATASAPASVPAAQAPAGNLPLLARSAIPLSTVPAATTPAEVSAEVPAEVHAAPAEPETPANESAIDTSYRNPDKQYIRPNEVARFGAGRNMYGSFDGIANIAAADLKPQDDNYRVRNYLMPENAYAEGGAVDEPTQEAPLEEAIGAALHGVQTEYGLGQERSALPGSDPERQSDMTAFARNEGAMSPQEMKTVLSTVDPEGRMPRGEANALALQKLYNHYAKTGDEGVAQEAASSFVQGARANSMRLGSLAIAAMEQGDMAGAGKALIMSYDQIPDGRTVQGEVDQSGNGTINIVDTRTGKAVQQMQVTPQLLKMAAMKLSDGSEFYSHLSRMAPQKSAAPQRQAALPAYYTGGPVKDQDVDPAVDGEDAADEEVAHDASLSATLKDDTDEADLPAVGAIETSGTGVPGGAVPTPPEYVDMTGMNTAQRAQATAVNRQRAQVYAQEMQNYRQGEVEARQQRGRLEQEQFRQRAAGERVTAASAAAAALEQSRQRAAGERVTATSAAAAALSAKQDRQKIEGEQRSRQNGLTDADIRAETNRANEPVISSIKDLTAQSINPQYRASALPVGEDGVQMPVDKDGNRPDLVPRTGEEAMRSVSGAFDREFALSPGDKAKAMRTRSGLEQNIQDRDIRAADVGARAYAKDRSGLEAAIDTIFEDKDEGLFTMFPKNGKPAKGEALRENGRIYFGHKVPPKEKAALKTWAFKLARANPDMPISSAGYAVMRLASVDESEPDAAPNFKIKIDEKTGAGRVVMKDGSMSFNLDGESLREVLTHRQLKADQATKKLKADADRRTAEDKLYNDRIEGVKAFANGVADLGTGFVDEMVTKNPVIGGTGRAIGDAVGTAGRYVGRKFIEKLGNPNTKTVDPEAWSDPSGYGAIPISPR